MLSFKPGKIKQWNSTRTNIEKGTDDDDDDDDDIICKNKNGPRDSY
jgi:hypothetical protein